MQTTVSDVLLFSKCPYAWFAKNYWKREKRDQAQALTVGTSKHKDFQEFFTKARDVGSLNFSIPTLHAIPDKDRAELAAFMKGHEVIHVEEVVKLNIGGHTILGRPDAVFKNRGSKQYWVGQLKTSRANRAHHIDFVRFSLHECVYQKALTDSGLTVTGTVLFRYIIPKNKPDECLSFHIDNVVRSKGDITAAERYIARICDIMEEMTLGKNEEGWQTPSSCIDWTTGIKCEYFGHCHHNIPLSDESFRDVANRYPEESLPED